MKKLISIFLLLIISFIFSSCSNNVKEEIIIDNIYNQTNDYIHPTLKIEDKYYDSTVVLKADEVSYYGFIYRQEDDLVYAICGYSSLEIGASSSLTLKTSYEEVDVNIYKRDVDLGLCLITFNSLYEYNILSISTKSYNPLDNLYYFNPEQKMILKTYITSYNEFTTRVNISMDYRNLGAPLIDTDGNVCGIVYNNLENEYLSESDEFSYILMNSYLEKEISYLEGNFIRHTKFANIKYVDKSNLMFNPGYYFYDGITKGVFISLIRGSLLDSSYRYSQIISINGNPINKYNDFVKLYYFISNLNEFKVKLKVPIDNDNYQIKEISIISE